jgi:uncharacterized protein (DUF1697 family)
MQVYIALFRGINVGGNHILPMKNLVEILAGLGAESVSTYIQSGNAVFRFPETDPDVLAKKIAEEINRQYGFSPQVLVLSREELRQIIAANPFKHAESDPAKLHAGFLWTEPPKPDDVKLDQLKSDSEQHQLIGRVFYLYAPDGVGRSKLAAGAEKCLGVPMTDRNWNTVRKIQQMADALGE